MEQKNELGFELDDSGLMQHYGHLLENQGKDFRNENLRRLITSYVQRGNVLDTGCGTGHLALSLLEKGHKVICIDRDPLMVSVTKKLLANRGFNVDVILVDLPTWNTSQQFDNIVCIDVIEHIKDDETALRKLHTLLADQGKLILVVPAIAKLYGKRDYRIGHWRRYDRKALIARLNSLGFKIISQRYWGLLGLIAYFIFEKVLRREVEEGFRYSPKGNWLGRILTWWYQLVENPLHPPIGLSLIVIAQKWPSRCVR